MRMCWKVRFRFMNGITSGAKPQSHYPILLRFPWTGTNRERCWKKFLPIPSRMKECTRSMNDIWRMGQNITSNNLEYINFKCCLIVICYKYITFPRIRINTTNTCMPYSLTRVPILSKSSMNNTMQLSLGRL